MMTGRRAHNSERAGVPGCRRLWPELIAPALLGVLTLFGLPPFIFYPAALIGLIGLFPLWWRASLYQAMWRGGVFGAALAGGQLYTGLHGPVTAVADPAIFLAAVMPVALAVLTGAIASMTRHLPALFWALIVVPAAWGFVEIISAMLVPGWAWFSLGEVALAAPLKGIVAVVGRHGLAIAVMLAAGVLWQLYTGTLPARLITAAGVAGLPLLLWLVPPPAYWTYPASREVAIAVLPAPSQNSRDDEPPGRRLMHYIAMTKRSDADLVVWPPLKRIGDRASLKKSLQHLDTTARSKGQAVIGRLAGSSKCAGFLALGAVRTTLIPCEKGKAPVRTPAFVHSHGMEIALVGDAWSSTGPDWDTFLSGAGLLVGLPVQSQVGLSSERAMVPARLEALQIGRPMVWSSVTSGNALLAYDGRVLHVVPPGRMERLRVEPTARDGITPYANYDDWPLWLLVYLIVPGSLAWAFRRYRKKRRGRR